MTDPTPAHEPEDLGRFFVHRANAGDVAGLVALYEPDAVLATTGGEVRGSDAPTRCGGATAEVARRRPDGTWRWVLDRPNVVG